MAPSYQDHLAAQLVSEGNIVTYRSLSRDLKVHVNTAKRMLYEFHRSQNERKPKSLIATYLLSGTRSVASTGPSSSTAKTTGAPPTGEKGSQDIEMGDSFVFSSSLPDTAAAEQEAEESQRERSETVPIRTVTLVQEADLETLRSTYTTLDSIHVYALSPASLKSLGTLSATNQSATISVTTQEDPLETYKTYGTIYNPHTKRRTSKRPTNAPTPATPATTAGMKGPVAKQGPTATSAAATSKPPTTTSSTTTTTSTKPPLKKQSSNIMSSFAKQPAAAKKPPPQAEDSPMKDVSDDEGADADFAPGVDVDANATAAKEKAEATRQARKEREEKLKQMMEAESESDKEGDKPKGEDAQDEDAPLEEAEWPSSPPPEDKTNSNTQVSRDGESQNTQADSQATANGTRRGRRRVIKKKKVTDDEGFIVTKEESEWESFSEDEAPPAPVPGGSKQGNRGSEKPKAVAKSALKGDRKSGNIMSFFAKK